MKLSQDTIKGEGVVINESEHLLASLDQRMRNLNQLRPLPSETSRSLADALRVRVTYTSNAIEGNHLTLAETQVVLEGITVGGKPLRDHLEAIDHAEAWDAVIRWSQSDQPLTPWLLRSLHALVLCRSQPGGAGHYREVPVAISGSTFIPPAPGLNTQIDMKVPRRFKHLFWNADLAELNTKDHGPAIAIAVLEQDNPHALAWAIQNLSPEAFAVAALPRRGSTPAMSALAAHIAGKK